EVFIDLSAADVLRTDPSGRIEAVGNILAGGVEEVVAGVEVGDVAGRGRGGDVNGRLAQIARPLGRGDDKDDPAVVDQAVIEQPQRLGDVAGRHVFIVGNRLLHDRV